MNRILVTCATMAGSTVEVAQTVAEEIARSGLQVDVLPLNEGSTWKPMTASWSEAP